MRVSIQQVTVYVGFCLSLIINTVLMYMIRKKTTKQLGSYVYLMLSFSVFELVFSTVDVLNQPMIFVDDGKFLFFTSNPLHLNATLAKHFNLLNFACFGIIISLLAIHFFYRYMAVCNNQKWLRQFEMPKFFLWTLIFTLFGLEWYIATLLLGDSSGTECEVEVESFDSFEPDSAPTVFLGIKYYVSTSFDTTFCGKSIILAVILLKIMLVSGGIVTYCGMRTWREILIKKRAVSRRTLDLQRQFFRALVVQTLIPVLLLYLPLSTMLAAPIFMASLEKVDVLIQFAFVFYPILDPIAVLMIVRDYRRSIRGFLDELLWQRFVDILKCFLPILVRNPSVPSPVAGNLPANPTTRLPIY